MERQARMPYQLLTALRMHKRSVLDDCYLELLAGGHVAPKAAEEADEPPTPMAYHSAPDHRAVESVPYRQQSRAIVALPALYCGTAPARFQRQPWLSAVGCLDFVDPFRGSTVVDWQHDHVSRLTELEVDDVGQFVGDARAARVLERAPAMPLKVTLLQDTAHRSQRNARRPSHGGPGAMRGLVRRIAEGQRRNAHHGLGRDRGLEGLRILSRARRSACLGEALRPVPDHRACDAKLLRDLLCRSIADRSELHLRPIDALSLAIAVRRDCLRPLDVPKADQASLCHPGRLACQPADVNRPNAPRCEIVSGERDLPYLKLFGVYRRLCRITTGLS